MWSCQTSGADFSPRKAPIQKFRATFLGWNELKNMFRCRLDHFEAIWGGLKCYFTPCGITQKCTFWCYWLLISTQNSAVMFHFSPTSSDWKSSRKMLYFINLHHTRMSHRLQSTDTILNSRKCVFSVIKTSLSKIPNGTIENQFCFSFKNTLQ